MRGSYLVVTIGSLCFFIHRLNAEEFEATAGPTFHHLDGEWSIPSVRSAEDAEHGVQPGRESRGGSCVRLAVGGHDNDAHGVGDFAGLIVGHLYGLCDCIRHEHGLVQMFIELFGILECGVELDLAFAGRGVDEVLDGAELSVFGVECDECGAVVVFHGHILLSGYLLFFLGFCA